MRHHKASEIYWNFYDSHGKEEKSLLFLNKFSFLYSISFCLLCFFLSHAHTKPPWRNCLLRTFSGHQDVIVLISVRVFSQPSLSNNHKSLIKFTQNISNANNKLLWRNKYIYVFVTIGCPQWRFHSPCCLRAVSPFYSDNLRCNNRAVYVHCLNWIIL